MKKLMCLLFNHKWDNDPVSVDQVVTCKRCGCVKKVVEIDMGPMGGQVVILETIK